jgi:hypothetical protein
MKYRAIPNVVISARHLCAGKFKDSLKFGGEVIS